jgi:hypothetical protein
LRRLKEKVENDHKNINCTFYDYLELKCFEDICKTWGEDNGPGSHTKSFIFRLNELHHDYGTNFKTLYEIFEYLYDQLRYSFCNRRGISYSTNMLRYNATLTNICQLYEDFDGLICTILAHIRPFNVEFIKKIEIGWGGCSHRIGEL